MVNMTRDEILAMPAGREMDALIAEKVMGLKVDYEFEGFGGLRVPSLVDKYDDWGYLPDYSTDISAAWQVVEKLSGLSAFVEVTLYDCGHNSCKIHPFKDIYVEAETAPLAICRAALLAVQEEA